jgi:dephospho-CoA kinase
MSDLSPLKIGITGGIGSGKTSVARLLEQMGYPIYFADERAKWLLQNHEALKKQLVQLLGNEVYTLDGALNKKLIAERIFEDKALLNNINKLVHPYVRDDFFSWVKSQSQHKYVFKEAAILLESQTQAQLDVIVLVYSPKVLRLQRATVRDSATPAQIISRMNQQWTDKYKMNYIHYAIYNDNTHPLKEQILVLLNFLEKIKLEIAKEGSKIL